MKTKIYLLTLLALLCVSCKDKKPTIDTTIQAIAENALYNQLEALNADAGIAIIMDSETGAIKAIANKNLSENDSIETASLFKIPCMIVALDDNVISSSDEFDTGNGILKHEGITITDHNANIGGYGTITAEQVIMLSSNVGMAKIILKGYENNPEKFLEGLNKYGFTDIPQYENWHKTTLAQLSFGYGVKATPLQMLEFYNSIANGTVKCSPSSLKAIQKMLVDVVENGTGRAVKSDKVKIAGKTGTVQIADGNHRVMFCGYFPADNPKYTGIVIIDNPKEGYLSGGVMAGSVFKEIAEEVK